MVKVKVDEDACIGCGACVALAPEVFEIGDDGKSHVKLKDVPEKLAKKVKEAAESCPTNSIRVEE